jgi:hypothetical protein
MQLSPSCLGRRVNPSPRLYSLSSAPEALNGFTLSPLIAGRNNFSLHRERSDRRNPDLAGKTTLS